MNPLKPTAAGIVGQTPLPNLLAYLLDHQLTGTLVLEDRQGRRSAIHVEQGYPVKVRTAEPVVLLGQVLVQMGLLTVSEADHAAEEAQRSERLYGQHLVAKGRVTGEQIEQAVREQMRRRVLWMFGLPDDSVYGFYQEQNLLAGWGGEETRIPVLPLVWCGIRDQARPERVQATLDRLGDRILRFSLQAQPGRFQFDRREQALVDVLRAKPQSLASLESTGLLDQATIRKMIYMLAITRHLDLGGNSRPIGVEDLVWHSTPADQALAPGTAAGVVPEPRAGGGVKPQVDGAPRGLLPAEVEELKAEIRQRAAQLADQNYYELLGVDRHTDTASIQAAFFQLAKKWHPDRLGPEFEDVRELVTRVFARMTEAHALLIDGERRREYDRSLTSGSTSEEQEHVARVLSAARAHQRAEILLKRNQLELAEHEAKLALEGDPEQPDHIALYAWIVASRRELAGPVQYDDLIALLDRAVELGPNNRQARFWRGQLLKRAGRMEDAIKDFRWVAREDPHNVDAAREVRLYERRRGERERQKHDEAHDRPSGFGPEHTGAGPAPRKAGGIWDRLFRR